MQKYGYLQLPVPEPLQRKQPEDEEEKTKRGVAVLIDGEWVEEGEDETD